MTWATQYIERLKRGETVQFRPRGNSMRPRIESGQLVTVAPTGVLRAPTIDDAVLCRCEGRDWLHLVKATTVERPPAPKLAEHGRRFMWDRARSLQSGWEGRMPRK